MDSWTGIEGLTDLAGPSYSSIAYGVSRDGSAVVGTGHNGVTQEAFLWTRVGGLQGFGPAHGAHVSDDGQVVVGTAAAKQPYRWTQATGPVDLGFTATGQAISADGSIIVGESEIVADIFEAYCGRQAVASEELGICREAVFKCCDEHLGGRKLYRRPEYVRGGRRSIPLE